MPAKISILFLCTGNSARSIMAEAIANHLFADQLTASSAGSKPTVQPHPQAIKTLNNHGVPTEGLSSKSWNLMRHQSFDLVITLCASAAKETCPTFPGAPIQVHWGFPDPPAADDSQELFEQVYQGIVEALRAIVDGDGKDIHQRAENVSCSVAKRFPLKQRFG